MTGPTTPPLPPVDLRRAEARDVPAYDRLSSTHVTPCACGALAAQEENDRRYARFVRPFARRTTTRRGPSGAVVVPTPR